MSSATLVYEWTPWISDWCIALQQYALPDSADLPSVRAFASAYAYDVDSCSQLRRRLPQRQPSSQRSSSAGAHGLPLPPGRTLHLFRPRYPRSADDPGWRHHYAASGGSSSSPGDHTYGGSSTTPDGPPPTPPGATRTPLRRPSPLADLLDRRRARPDARPPALPFLAAAAPAPRFPDTCGRGPSFVPPLRLSWTNDPRLRGPPTPLWGWHGPRLSTNLPRGTSGLPVVTRPPPPLALARPPDPSGVASRAGPQRARSFPWPGVA